MNTNDATVDLLAEMEQISSFLAYSKSSTSINEINAADYPPSPTKSMLSISGKTIDQQVSDSDSDIGSLENEKNKNSDKNLGLLLNIEEINSIPTKAITPPTPNMVTSSSFINDNETSLTDFLLLKEQNEEKLLNNEGDVSDNELDSGENTKANISFSSFTLPKSSVASGERLSSVTSQGFHNFGKRNKSVTFNTQVTTSSTGNSRRVSSYAWTTDDDFQSATDDIDALANVEELLKRGSSVDIENHENIESLEEKELAEEDDDDDQDQSITGETERETDNESVLNCTLTEDTLSIQEESQIENNLLSELKPPVIDFGSLEVSTPSPQFSAGSSQFSGKPSLLHEQNESPASSTTDSRVCSDETETETETESEKRNISPKLFQDFNFKTRIISNSEYLYIYNNQNDMLSMDSSSYNDDSVIDISNNEGKNNLDPLRRNTIRSKNIQKQISLSGPLSVRKVESRVISSKHVYSLGDIKTASKRSVSVNQEKLKNLTSPESVRVSSINTQTEKLASKLNLDSEDNNNERIYSNISDATNVDEKIGESERNLVESCQKDLLLNLKLPEIDLNDEIMKQFDTFGANDAEDLQISNQQTSKSSYKVWSSETADCTINDDFEALGKSNFPVQAASITQYTKMDPKTIQNILKSQKDQETYYAGTISTQDKNVIKELGFESPFRANTSTSQFVVAKNNNKNDDSNKGNSLGIFNVQNVQNQNTVQAMDINEMLYDQGNSVVVEKITVPTSLKTFSDANRINPFLKPIEMYPLEDVFDNSPSTPVQGNAASFAEKNDNVHIGSPFKVKSTHEIPLKDNSTLSNKDASNTQKKVDFSENIQYKIVKNEKFSDMGQIYLTIKKMSNLSLFKDSSFKDRGAEYCIVFDNGINIIQSSWEKITEETINKDKTISLDFSSKEFESRLPLKDGEVDHFTTLVNLNITLQVKYTKTPDKVIEVQERVPIYSTDSKSKGKPSKNNRNNSPMSYLEFTRQVKKHQEQQNPQQQQQSQPAERANSLTSFFRLGKSKKRAESMKSIIDYQVVTKKMVKPGQDSWKGKIAPDGSFGFANFDINLHMLNEFKYRNLQLNLPLYNKWDKFASKVKDGSLVGTLELEMCYLPRVSNSERFPKTLSKALKIIEKSQEQATIKHQGWLYQEGGDVTKDMMMTRRYFKLQGVDFVGYHELSQKQMIKLNLLNVSEVVYGTPLKSQQRHVSNPLLQDFFELKFSNGEKIKFITETHDQKIEWLAYLEKIVQLNVAHQPWVTEFSKSIIV